MAAVVNDVEPVTALKSDKAVDTAGPSAWLTVERLLYALALCAGALVRFWNLGAMPLLPAEAANAWPAFAAAQAHHVDGLPAPSSALLYGLQWLLFWIGADGDAAARLGSAAAGTLLVLWPWTWRRWIGRGAALILAWLVAFDPWLVALSRLADGAAFGLILGLLCLTGLLRLATADMGKERVLWRRTAAASAGLLLVSGELAWSWLPVLAIVVWVYRRPLLSARLWERQTLSWAAGAAILGGSLILMRPEGLAWASVSLSSWLDAQSRLGSYGLAWPWIRLLVDEPIVWALGLVGLAGMSLRQPTQTADKLEGWAVWLWLWLAWGAALVLLPGRSPLDLPMVGLPLLVGAAWMLAWWMEARPRDLEWREAGALGATLAVLIVSGSFWGAALFFSPVFDPVMAQATVVIFMLAAAILVIYALWADRRHALWLTVGVAAIVLGLATLRSGWQLNHMDVPSVASGLYTRATHPELRLLVQDVETLSAHRTGTPHQLPVLVQVASHLAPDGALLPATPDPILGWSLRAMRDVQWVPAPSAAAMAGSGEETDAGIRALAITWVGDDGAGEASSDGKLAYALPDGYVGSVYQIESGWPAGALAFEGAAGDPAQSGIERLWSPWLQPLLRWLVYRTPPAPAPTRDVILWAPVAGS